jgi:tRNA pseudouridine38-40 synthase
MPTYKITLAYDGTGFIGWQRQASGVSVQGLVEDAVRPIAGADVAVAGAGRTDAGVHSVGQVASFALERAVDPPTLVRAMNARLPAEVRVLSAETVPASFHARFSARGKSYQYRIWNADVQDPFERAYAWHVIGALDVTTMSRAASYFEGEHDFAAFQAADSTAKSTVREVFHCGVRIAECGLRSSYGSDPIPHAPLGTSHSAFRIPHSSLEKSMILVDVSGDGFLRHMVRTLVGSLVDIGRGRRPAEWIQELLASRRRTDAGPTTPARGLFLVSVDYGPSARSAPTDDELSAGPSSVFGTE